MTWKSTAAASGLMVVATWLASHAPVGGPRQQSVAPSAARTETAAAEIQREADRLHGRLQQVAAYKLPARNLFQFSERPAPVSRRAVSTVSEPPPVADPPPVLAPQIVLAGIAEDVVDGQVVRSAIISARDNVHVLKVGDTLGDAYKVTAIDANSAELVRLDDGSTIQLSLTKQF